MTEYRIVKLSSSIQTAIKQFFQGNHISSFQFVFVLLITLSLSCTILLNVTSCPPEALATVYCMYT